MSEKSFFIVVDGIDGCGGTTHSRMLAGFLESKNLKVHLTQEPSNSEIGKLLRKYLKDKTIHPSTDALLFAADRTYHYYNEIQEKLIQGYIVISDRYIESSIVYQSCQTEEISVEWVKIINKFIKKPDLTIILDVDPKISLSRKTGEDLEKFEDTTFLEKVRDLYIRRAKEENYHLLSSDDIIEIVEEKIHDIVINELKKRKII